MRRVISGLAVLTAVIGVSFWTQGRTVEAASVAHAETAGSMVDASFRDEFLSHFQRSSYKISELARVMPAEKFEWAPAEGIMQVAEVYMHLARYNFMYLDLNLGIAPPDGFDYRNIESIRDKDQVQKIFAMSVEHVNEQVGAMTAEQLNATTELYGRTVDGWAVLFQLISHMNEHVGQSVAYARMNDVSPPWSR